MLSFFRCRRDSSKCRNCNFCREYIFCPGISSRYYAEASYEKCIDCKVCYQACPYYSIERIPDKTPYQEIKIKVNGETVSVPERITVSKALEFLGYKSSPIPEEGDIFVPCGLGGCYACAMPVDGELKPICITSVKEGMSIMLETPADYVPIRRVSGYQPHSAGGVGTPWWVKKSGEFYIEVACFAHGCNFRCYQCQNFTITYDNVEPPSSPKEAAECISAYRKRFGVNRIAISGGEPTLNRPWLVSFFKELRALNPNARLHLDTNASILNPRYVDELVNAGMTDIGPDLKGLHVETFIKITGVTSRELAEKYLKNAWKITKYIVDNYYPEKVFIGVGIPYNRVFISLEEVREMGDKLFNIHPELQVTLLDYFPTFRRQDIARPTIDEMEKGRKVLKESGLKVVLAQTSAGTLGP